MKVQLTGAWLASVSDLIVLLVTLAFFGACLGYVRWCDRIIGPDEEFGASSVDDDAAAELETAA